MIESIKKKYFRVIFNFLRSKQSPISDIVFLEKYIDYPKIINAIPIFKTKINFFINANAADFSYETAYVKAAMEGLERYAAIKNDAKGLIYGSYNELSNKYGSDIILAPEVFSYFTKNQLKSISFDQFRFTRFTKIWWTKINEYLITKENRLKLNKQVYLPAHLVYFLNYSKIKKNDEKLIKVPDSNGLVAAFSFKEAVYKGILELVERDAYTISFFLKIPGLLIDKKDIKRQEINNLIDKLIKYNFDIYLIDISLDINIPTILCILIDKTQLQPKIVVGARSDVDFNFAIIAAIKEALQSLTPLRDFLQSKQNKFNEIVFSANLYKNNPILKRVFFWAEKGDKKDLWFWLNSSRNNPELKYKNIPNSLDKKIKVLLSELNKNNIKKIYIKNFNSKKINNEICLLKILIPDLCPIFINQQYKYLRQKRFLYFQNKLGVKKVNNLFHPLP